MKILLIAQEPPLDPSGIVTGNAIRARQLTRSLESAGHQVVHAWHQGDGNGQHGAFKDRDELRGLLLTERADVFLVCYWELLDLMPFDSDVPLVLDFIAPRPLEQLFENPGQVRHDLHRLKVNLSKADLVLVGNEPQKSLLLPLLLETGFDLRTETGVAVVPLAADMVGLPRTNPARDGWLLVAGGVNWPWRDSRKWWQALEDSSADLPELVRFGGAYSLHEENTPRPRRDRDMRPLEPYQAFSEFLLDHAHIGMELADENIERQHSQSFRSLEFLRHGLPVICNRYLPIARDIERFDAGWLIDRPGELPELLLSIMDDPDQWRNKSANAERLVRERLNPEIAATPLLKWLRKAHKATQLPSEEAAIPALKEPPVGMRLRRMANYAIWFLRRSIFLLQKRFFGGNKADGIVMVSRGDLFPADHGAAVKIVETARGLSRHGRAVALVTDDRKTWWLVENGKLQQRRIPFWLRLFSWPAVWIKFRHFTKDIPESNAFLYLPMTDGSFFWRTLYAGREVGASVIQAEFPAYVRTSIPASHVLDARVVLVEHNVEYDRIKAQVLELTEEQYRRYKAIEIDLANQCDAVICVSDNDRQQLAVDGVELARLHTVPHGVDLDQYDLPAMEGVREKYRIPPSSPLLVYHGTFAYPPNVEALEVFSRELLPRLDAAGLECHVLAVGREPPPSSPHPRIHLTGSVETVAPWLKAADIAVIPLLEGGGTRMKIIDCFAAGIPLISTSKGIEGIPVINGKQALVIDDWDEMAAAIRDLVENPEKAAAMAESAGQMARKLDWKSIAGRYLEIFETL